MKTDLFATITILKPVMLKSKTTKGKIEKKDVFIRKCKTLKIEEKTEIFFIWSYYHPTPDKRSDISSGLQSTCVPRLDDEEEL